MFSVHTTLEKIENATITGHFGFAFEDNSGREITSFSDYCEINIFENPRLQNVFRDRLQENEKPAFSNSSGLKSVFEKLHFRDGLVWKVGLTVEIKLRFQIYPE